jgi:hypothetical protein
MKLLIVQSSPIPRHFLPFTSKYFPQHPVPKHPLFSSLGVRDQVSYPYIATGKIIVLYVVRLREDKIS